MKTARLPLAKASAAKDALARWREPGAAGFLNFLEDVRPMIPSEKGDWQPFAFPNERVRSEVVAALDGGYSTLVWCWPRRHGKTVLSALIIVWRFLTRREQSIAIVANSERQTVDTAYRLVRGILQRTPYTAALIKSDAIKVQEGVITYPAVGNRVQGFPANASVLFGKKLSVAQVSELHAAKSDAVFQALSSGTIDSDDGLVLIDSTVGPRSSPLYALYQLAQAGTDPTLYFSHVSYADLEDAVANGPAWIKGARLRSRAAQMLPADFAQQHLNVWGDASSALFPAAVLDRCRATYPIDVRTLADVRPFAVGAGLDRAFGFSLHGDATVTCAVMKVIDGEDEHLYVLASDEVRFSSAGTIRRNLTAYQRDYGMSRAALEAYNVQDIAAWAADQKFASEVLHATPERQANAFTALYQAANEGRLHIHPRFAKLLAEMASFEYRLDQGQTGVIARFQHAKGAHDDHVYALAWAVYALREIEMSPYELRGITCDAPGPVARLCILNDGDIIPPCADECRSMAEVRGLYGRYRERAGIAPMALPDFFAGKVVNVGSHVVRR
jgi:hypothetical protein